ncbi:MAG: hypothetical protein KDA92_21505, partial [Planctomycetales bacterium]|nr:hypothetical protein [Planctomycetales bacterium]
MKLHSLQSNPTFGGFTLLSAALLAASVVGDANGQAPMRRSSDVPPVVVYRPTEVAPVYVEPVSGGYQETTTTYYAPSATPAGTLSTSDDTQRAVSFYPPLTTGVTAAPVTTYRPVVPTTTTTTYLPAVPAVAPVAAYQPVPVTSYRPVTAYQPVTTYQPVTSYTPVTALQPVT